MVNRKGKWDLDLVYWKPRERRVVICWIRGKAGYLRGWKEKGSRPLYTVVVWNSPHPRLIKSGKLEVDEE